MQYITFPDCKPSFAENIIINKLQSLRISFDREVSFTGLVNPTTGAPLRYDFYLPTFNLIIEYDGVDSHSADDVKERDAIKDKFAYDNKFKIRRISGIQNIEAFFKSEYWKRQVHKKVAHKAKNQKKKVKYVYYEEEVRPFKKIDYIPPKDKPDPRLKPKVEHPMYGNKVNLSALKKYKNGVKYS